MSFHAPTRPKDSQVKASWHNPFQYSWGITLAVSALVLSGCSASNTSAENSPSAENSSSSSAAPTSASPNASESEATQEPTSSASSSRPSSATASASSSAQMGVPAIKFDGSFDKFVPATEKAPASHVPHPIEPVGMNEQTDEGFAKFVKYFMAERNYAVTTGDTATWRKLVTPTGAPTSAQQAELQFLDQVDAAYQNGGWVVAGQREQYIGYYQLGDSKKSDRIYQTYALENGTIVLNPRGNPPRMQWVAPTQDPCLYTVGAKFENGRWVMTEQAADYTDTYNG